MQKVRTKKTKAKKDTPKKKPIRKLLPPKVRSRVGLRALRAAVKAVQAETEQKAAAKAKRTAAKKAPKKTGGSKLFRSKARGTIGLPRLRAVVKAVREKAEKKVAEGRG